MLVVGRPVRLPGRSSRGGRPGARPGGVQMSLWSRFWFLYRVRTTAALDRLEDPRETLDYAYDQQQEMLGEVRRGLVEVATAKRQLQQQMRRLEDRIPRLDEQARRALALGREDLATQALHRREAAVAELSDLERQVDEVAEEERRLAAAQQALAARVDEFRGRRQVMSARYTAAEAQVRAKEALTGVSDELTELGKALGRAEEKTERMRARASAIDALIDLGALDLPLGGDDAVERELRRAHAEQAVAERLTALKAELAAKQSPPPAEPAGSTGPAPDQPPPTESGGPTRPAADTPPPRPAPDQPPPASGA